LAEFHARPLLVLEDRNGRGSLQQIERVVREDKVEGTELKLRMTLTAENAPLNHIVEETIDLR
jgi:hypothetical protein